MLTSVILPLLAAITASESEGDKPFYFRSYENASPTIHQYKIVGTLGSAKILFTLSLNFSNGRWYVDIAERGKPVRKIILDKAYNSIPVNKIVVASDGSSSNLLVIIPFGSPHSKCFLNGEDVYSNIVIEANGRIGLEHFPECRMQTATLPVKKLKNAVEVGPPPR
jgi:hypothetical protein